VLPANWSNSTFAVKFCPSLSAKGLNRVKKQQSWEKESNPYYLITKERHYHYTIPAVGST
jgi:hypothetical protein